MPQGINYFSLSRDLRSLARLDDNFLALSIFEPDAAWTVWNATKRNGVIVGVSEGLFVIEAREKGGTLRAGQECIRQKKPLWVIEYEEKNRQRRGNEVLLGLSGRPVRTKQDLKAILENLRGQTNSCEKQLALPTGEVSCLA